MSEKWWVSSDPISASYRLDQDHGDVQVVLTDDEVADYQRVWAEFSAWQLRLAATAKLAHSTDHDSVEEPSGITIGDDDEEFRVHI